LEIPGSKIRDEVKTTDNYYYYFAKYGTDTYKDFKIRTYGSPTYTILQ